MVAEERCACGLPLHYTDPTLRAQVEGIIATAGTHVLIVRHTGDGTTMEYMVPRHYVALHGISARELEATALKYGFKRVQ